MVIFERYVDQMAEDGLLILLNKMEDRTAEGERGVAGYGYRFNIYFNILISCNKILKRIGSSMQPWATQKFSSMSREKKKKQN